jgi:hypothetical protein
VSPTAPASVRRSRHTLQITAPPLAPSHLINAPPVQMSPAIVSNSPSSHSGVESHPAPLPPLSRDKRPSSHASCVSVNGHSGCVEHASHPICNRIPEGPRREGPVPPPSLTSRSCATRHSRPRPHICKARSIPGTRLPRIPAATAAPGPSAQIPQTGRFAAAAPARTQARARASSASPRTNEEARGRNPGPLPMYGNLQSVTSDTWP